LASSSQIHLAILILFTAMAVDRQT